MDPRLQENGCGALRNLSAYTDDFKALFFFSPLGEASDETALRAGQNSHIWRSRACPTLKSFALCPRELLEFKGPLYVACLSDDGLHHDAGPFSDRRVPTGRCSCFLYLAQHSALRFALRWLGMRTCECKPSQVCSSTGARDITVTTFRYPEFCISLCIPPHTSLITL